MEQEKLQYINLYIIMKIKMKKDIERRYYDSLKNLNEVIKICDEVNIYDNTEVLREIAYLKQGKIVWADKKIPKWLKINF